MKGKVIITTQPADQAEKMLWLLRESGARAFNLPMIQTHTIELAEDEIKKILTPGTYNMVIFTSKKGVRGFFHNVNKVSGNYQIPPDLKIAVIGKSTATEVEAFGLKPYYFNPATNAQGMADYLLNDILNSEIKILLALGTLAPDFLEKALSEKTSVKRLNVYETIYLSPEDQETSQLVRDKSVDMCIFTSPSGFCSFLNSFPEIKGLNLAAIGSTTDAAIKAAGYQSAVVSPDPSAETMVDEIKRFFARNTTQSIISKH